MTSLPVFENAAAGVPWRDSLDREFDFYLEHFPEEPGPREIIIPHNPVITREMEIKKGDIADRPAAGNVVRMSDHALRRGDRRRSAHRRDRLVRDRPARAARKGLQGPRLLHRRRLRRAWSTKPAWN